MVGARCLDSGYAAHFGRARCSRYCDRFSLSSYLDGEVNISMVSKCSVAKPGSPRSAARSCASAGPRRPAAAAPARSRRPRTPAGICGCHPRRYAANPVVARFEAAGAKPEWRAPVQIRMAVASEMPRAKRNTPESRRIDSMRGSGTLAGIIARMLAIPSSRPPDLPAHPASASSRLSESSCCRMRRRPAPSAARKRDLAQSCRWRASAAGSPRWRRRSAAPGRPPPAAPTAAAGRFPSRPRGKALRRRSNPYPCPAVPSESCCATAAISCCACGRLTPGFRRAIVVSHRPPLRASVAVEGHGHEQIRFPTGKAKIAAAARRRRLTDRHSA